jgi:hypothetical protein
MRRLRVTGIEYNVTRAIAHNSYGGTCTPDRGVFSGVPLTASGIHYSYGAAGEVTSEEADVYPENMVYGHVNGAYLRFCEGSYCGSGSETGNWKDVQRYQ